MAWEFYHVLIGKTRTFKLCEKAGIIVSLFALMELTLVIVTVILPVQRLKAFLIRNRLPGYSGTPPLVDCRQECLHP